MAYIIAALSVPSTHLIRLSLPAADMHRYGLQQYLAGHAVYMCVTSRSLFPSPHLHSAAVILRKGAEYDGEAEKGPLPIDNSSQ